MIHHSESIKADSLKLIHGLDYLLDYENGLLRLIRMPETEQLQIEYILVPTNLHKPVQLYEIQPASDSLFARIVRKPKVLFNPDGKLEIKGSKTFAIAFSDDESFDLKQSLFVNLTGELSQGVNLEAQLSDSQSKLSPEGDSKELSSLDKVFVKLYGKNYELAMGDLNLEFRNSRYLEYQSSFEGLSASYKNHSELQAAFAAGSGKSSTVILPIVDGKQGPYYLRPNDYQPGYLVVAGSEEVFVDGSRWERGLDYSIDYSEGSLMFKRLVYSANNVLVRFQYSDEFYPVSSYFSSSYLPLGYNLSFRHHFIWQQDDKRHPLATSFSEADLDSLRQAGDNVIWGNGVNQVAEGTGSYKLAISQTGTEYYEYAPGDSLAVYDLIFSYVGFGMGDYQEFSSGKFRFAGIGQGSWQPQKRLIPPAKTGNLELIFAYQGSAFTAGVETLGSLADKNTLSEKDDGDNLGGLIFTYAELPWASNKVRLEHEERTANTKLFGKYRNPETEYDFNALAKADSLAQRNSDLLLSHLGEKWKLSLLLRYRDIADLNYLKALRISSSSSGKGLLPAINLLSTLAEQQNKTAAKDKSQLQYLQGDLAWIYKSLRLKLAVLQNSLLQSSLGTDYQKLNPQLSWGNNAKLFSQISFSADQSKVKNQSVWTTQNRSETYAYKQVLNLGQQRLDLEFTHRQLRQPSSENPVSSYDLVNLRSNLSALKQMLSLYTNYQLNQTEFFPKIRELQYVGNGLGLYDSTGVSITDGDYDYVFITSSQGTLASDINALWTLYLKPGNYLQGDWWKRWQIDSTLQLSEQSSNRDDWKRYLFWPGTVYNETNTIFGRQNLQQTLWVELIQNHMNASLQQNLERSLDKRYQSPERSYSLQHFVQMDIKGYSSYSTRLLFSRELAQDSRYLSSLKSLGVSTLVQRNLAVQSNLQAELSYTREDGGKQDGSETYLLHSYYFSPSIRSVWLQKYRFSGSFSLTYNILSGSGYFGFLPNKRAGWIPGLSLSGIYRLNNFSSLSLEYRFNDYPAQKSSHELKLEFKAEL